VCSWRFCKIFGEHVHGKFIAGGKSSVDRVNLGRIDAVKMVLAIRENLAFMHEGTSLPNDPLA
jgi:hypothetical protein